MSVSGLQLGRLHKGADTFLKMPQLNYGDVLRPLDLCMRIDDNATQQLEEGTKTVINLQPPPPHNNGQPQLNHLNLTEKLSSAARNTGVQNLMRNISFTPSPSSSSSFDNEEDMGCVGPPPFTIYRKNPAPVKVH